MEPTTGPLPVTRKYRVIVEEKQEAIIGTYVITGSCLAMGLFRLGI